MLAWWIETPRNNPGSRPLFVAQHTESSWDDLQSVYFSGLSMVELTSLTVPPTRIKVLRPAGGGRKSNAWDEEVKVNGVPARSGIFPEISPVTTRKAVSYFGPDV